MRPTEVGLVTIRPCVICTQPVVYGPTFNGLEADGRIVTLHFPPGFDILGGDLRETVGVSQPHHPETCQCRACYLMGGPNEVF